MKKIRGVPLSRKKLAAIDWSKYEPGQPPTIGQLLSSIDDELRKREIDRLLGKAQQ